MGYSSSRFFDDEYVGAYYRRNNKRVVINEFRQLRREHRRLQRKMAEHIKQVATILRVSEGSKVDKDHLWHQLAEMSVLVDN